MTADVVALCREQPGVDALAAALEAAGRGLTVRGVEQGGMVQLCDEDGRALVTIEGPLFVQVDGEARRLLDPGIEAPSPVWWMEARAAAHRPEAIETAHRFAAELVAATGGCTWPATPEPGSGEYPVEPGSL